MVRKYPELFVKLVWIVLQSVLKQQRTSAAVDPTEGISTVSIEKQKVDVSVAILQRGGSLAANL